MSHFHTYYNPVLSHVYIKSPRFLTKEAAHPLPTNQNILSFYHPIILSL